MRWPALRAGLLEGLRHRLILVTSSAHAGQFVLNGALSAFLPLYGRDVVGLTTPQLGWLFAGQTVTTLAARPFIGAMSDRVGRRGVIVAGLTVCSIAVWALSVTASGWVLAAGVAATTAATSAFITDVSRRARYGTAHGVFGTIYDIGDAAGPIGAGFLVAAVGYAPMFRTLAVVGLVMAVVFAVASRPGVGEDSCSAER